MAELHQTLVGSCRSPERVCVVPLGKAQRGQSLSLVSVQMTTERQLFTVTTDLQQQLPPPE